MDYETFEELVHKQAEVIDDTFVPEVKSFGNFRLFYKDLFSLKLKKALPQTIIYAQELPGLRRLGNPNQYDYSYRIYSEFNEEQMDFIYSVGEKKGKKLDVYDMPIFLEALTNFSENKQNIIFRPEGKTGILTNNITIQPYLIE